MPHPSHHTNSAHQRQANDHTSDIAPKLYEEQRTAQAKPVTEDYRGPAVFGVPLPLLFLIVIILLGVAGLVGKVVGLF